MIGRLHLQSERRHLAAGNEETIAMLNTLIECCKDSEYSFRASARHLESNDLQPLLVGRADDCRRAARDLQDLVVALGGEARNGGSVSAALRRAWVGVRAIVVGYSDRYLLDECARCEDKATVRYRMALEQPLPATLKEVVERQARDVKLSRNEISALHDWMWGPV